MSVQSDWHMIEPDHISKFASSEKDCSGKGFVFYISPMDVPSAWREKCIESLNGISWKKVEFKYMGSPENVKSVDVSSWLKIDVGKRSGRIYAILLGEDHLVKNGDCFDLDEESYLQLKSNLESTKSSQSLSEGNVESIFIIIEDECKFGDYKVLSDKNKS